MKHSSPLCLLTLLLVTASAPSSSAASILFDWARAGTATKIAGHLRSGNSADPRDAKGMTPLMTALLSRQFNAARTLIEGGANVKAVSYKGTSVIACAANAGDVSMVRLLTSKGAPVDGKGSSGHTALQFAIIRGHDDIARHLIAQGANVNYRGLPNDTPLALAAYYGNLSMMKHLLSKGAGRDGQSPNQKVSALHKAAGGGHIAIMKYCIETLRVDINSTLPSGFSNRRHTALTNAAIEGNASSIRYLLSAGADVRADFGCSIRHAQENGHTEIVALLSKRGARVVSK